MLTQIYNGQILTPSGWISGGSLLFEDSRIVEIRKNSHIEPRADTAINALGMHVVPGGIELHCHGGGGHDFMEGTEEAFRAAVMAHRKHGTTAIFPTLSSATLPMMEAAASTCDKLIEDPFSGVLGLHLEGPYFIAHTAAEFDHVKAAYEAGYTHATHFYNGMPGFHNVREFKHAGTVEAVYLMENMTVEMIADGIHVPPTLLKLVYHTKGVERTAMVTDALAVAASDSNKAFDPRVIIEDGVCKLADRSALAGSIATMDRLIYTAVHMADIPLQDACRMVAETPARIMGVYDRKGSLQRGKDADILILDKDIKLHAVYSMGQRVNLDDKI